jgi:hypothetical protein
MYLLRLEIELKEKDIFSETSEKIWNCFKASNKRIFSQRVRRLLEWSSKNSIPPFYKT